MTEPEKPSIRERISKSLTALRNPNALMKYPSALEIAKENEVLHTLLDDTIKQVLGTTPPSTAGDLWEDTPEVSIRLPRVPFDLSLFYIIRWESVNLRNATDVIVEEIFRETLKEGVIFKPRFKVKCSQCHREFQEKINQCPYCAGGTLPPDPEQKRIWDKHTRICNSAKQSFLSVCQEMELDLEVVDDLFLVVKKEYLVSQSGTIAARVKELMRGDPVTFRIIANGQGIRGGMFWCCPLHRDTSPYIKESPGYCELLNPETGRRCGTKLRDVHYVELERGGTSPVGYYFEDEIIHTPKYDMSRLYGFSPVYTLWVLVRTMILMDQFVMQAYQQGRLQGILGIDAHWEYVKKWWDEVQMRLRQNPHYQPVIALGDTDAGERSKRMEFVKFMDSLQEMQYTQAQEIIRRQIFQMYGVSPIFQGDMSTGTGLANEGLQMTVTDRRVEFGQSIWHNIVFPQLCVMLGITDWEIQLRPSREIDEMAELQRFNLKAETAQKLLDIGFTVELSEDEQGERGFKFTGGPQKKEELGAGGFGGFGPSTPQPVSPHNPQMPQPQNRQGVKECGPGMIATPENPRCHPIEWESNAKSDDYLTVKCRETTFQKELQEAQDPNYRLFWTMDKVKANGDWKRARRLVFETEKGVKGHFEILGYGVEQYKGHPQHVVYFDREFHKAMHPEESETDVEWRPPFQEEDVEKAVEWFDKDMTWEECIDQARRKGARDPKALCGWLRYYGPHGSKKSSIPREWQAKVNRIGQRLVLWNQMNDYALMRVKEYLWKNYGERLFERYRLNEQTEIIRDACKRISGRTIREEMKEGGARFFNMVRKNDESGVSGTGEVGSGVVFPDGTTVFRWNSETPSTNIYKSFEEFEKVHITPHPSNETEIEWHDIKAMEKSGDMLAHYACMGNKIKKLGYSIPKEKSSGRAYMDYVLELKRKDPKVRKAWEDCDKAGNIGNSDPDYPDPYNDDEEEEKARMPSRFIKDVNHIALAGAGGIRQDWERLNEYGRHNIKQILWERHGESWFNHSAYQKKEFVWKEIKRVLAHGFGKDTIKAECRGRPPNISGKPNAYYPYYCKEVEIEYQFFVDKNKDLWFIGAKDKHGKDISKWITTGEVKQTFGWHGVNLKDGRNKGWSKSIESEGEAQEAREDSTEEMEGSLTAKYLNEFKSLENLKTKDQRSLIGEVTKLVNRTTQDLEKLAFAQVLNSYREGKESVLDIAKMAPPISTSGGKARMARRLDSIIPPHTNYNEPFLGGGSVFLRKEKADQNYLNDADPDVMKVWEILQKGEHFDYLSKQKWNADKSHFDKLKAMDPESLPSDLRAYRKIYLRRYSNMSKEQGFRSDNKDLGPPKWLRKEEAYRAYTEQLKGVNLSTGDWKVITRQVDSPETFHFIDPPYEEPFAKEMCKVLPTLKGKWLLTFGASSVIKDFFKDQVHEIQVKSNSNFWNVPSDSSRIEYLVTNYPIKVPKGTIFKSDQAPSSISFEELPFSKADIQVLETIYKENPFWDSFSGMTQSLSDKLKAVITDKYLPPDSKQFKAALKETQEKYPDDPLRIQMQIAYNRVGKFDLAKTIAEMKKIVGDEVYRLERIARSETTAITNKGREMAWSERDKEKSFRYDWVGPNDWRTSEECTEIKERIQKEGKGFGVPLSRVKEIMKDVVSEKNVTRKSKWNYRDWLPHGNCRHVLRRVV